ncbi:MAG TPA: histidinol dehydrogenase, partial [Bacteroidota bacterium]|nr:histidinol dehydrogenase [Bacteroidota bacterium]
MKTYYFQELSQNQYQQLLRRGGVFSPDVRRAAEEICLNVKQRKDEALKMYTAQFDGVSPSTWRVPEEEIQRARARQSDETLTALNTAAANIEKFHRSQLRTIRKVETLPGVVCWQENRP